MKLAHEVAWWSLRPEGASPKEMSGQVIIVNRDDPGLYYTLRSDWARDERLAVVLDRRVRERRRRFAGSLIERRRTERRQRPVIDAYVTWRGGGSSVRKSDILSVLDRAGAAAVLVRQLPGAHTAKESAWRQEDADRRNDKAYRAMIEAPMYTVVGLVVLLGTISGGLVGGVALWLFMRYEFAEDLTRVQRMPPSVRGGSDFVMRCRIRLQKLLASYQARTSLRHNGADRHRS